MSQVNLLPPEILERQKVRRTVVLIAGAGAIFALLIIGFYLLQAQKLADVQDQIDAQEASNSQIQAEIADLRQFEELEATAQARQELVTAAYASEVSFSALLMDISRVVPDASYLSSLSAVISPPIEEPEAEPTTDTGQAFVGSLSLGGQALEFKTLSTFLTRIEQVEGWVNPWMSSITQVSGIEDAYEFSLSVDLSQQVVTQRGRAGATGGGGGG